MPQPLAAAFGSTAQAGVAATCTVGCQRSPRAARAPTQTSFVRQSKSAAAFAGGFAGWISRQSRFVRTKSRPSAAIASR
jgi:hypothetical protein